MFPDRISSNAIRNLALILGSLVAGVFLACSTPLFGQSGQIGQPQPSGDPHQALELATRVKQAWAERDLEKITHLTGWDKVEMPEYFLDSVPTPDKPQVLHHEIRARAHLFPRDRDEPNAVKFLITQAERKNLTTGDQQPDAPYIDLIKQENEDWKLAQVGYFDPLISGDIYWWHGPSELTPSQADHGLRSTIQTAMNAFRNHQGVIDTKWFERQSFVCHQSLMFQDIQIQTNDYFLEKLFGGFVIHDFRIKQTVFIEMDEGTAPFDNNAIVLPMQWTDGKWQVMPRKYKGYCRMFVAPETATIVRTDGSPVSTEVTALLRPLFQSRDPSRCLPATYGASGSK